MCGASSGGWLFIGVGEVVPHLPPTRPTTTLARRRTPPTIATTPPLLPPRHSQPLTKPRTNSNGRSSDSLITRRRSEAPAEPEAPAARARTRHRSAIPRRDGAPRWNSAHEWWRWGESNPRPTVVQQDFSGCSSLAIFSAPASHANKDADGLSHLDVPGPPMTRDLSSGSLDDARNRGGSSPRADGLRSSLRRRGRSRCECYRHLLVRAGR